MLSRVCLQNAICFPRLHPLSQSSRAQVSISYPRITLLVSQNKENKSVPAIRESTAHKKLSELSKRMNRCRSNCSHKQIPGVFYSSSRCYDVPLPDFKAITVAAHHTSSFARGAEHTLGSHKNRLTWHRMSTPLLSTG